MAVRHGEENVATLFGDVHYFYSPDTEQPRHHRFDKGSYVYLFEDANNGRARIEVANHPGTDDQDDFTGFLDRVHVHYSYKQHCMVSLTVNDVPDQEDWHLPTYDPRNENKYHYKLHSLDIYFWTQQDALQFVNGVRRVLPPHQVEVLDEPAPPPRQAPVHEVSSVVQQLEKAALNDTASQRPVANGAPSFAPPPLSAVSAESSTTPPHVFVPMAYNPAAPAAPEAIQHREKTPPPEDAGPSPLHQRLAQDASTPFSPGLPRGPTGLGPLSPGIPPPSFASPPGAPLFPAPPPHSVSSPGMAPPGFGQHTHPSLTRAATMPVQSPSPFSAFPGSPGYVAPHAHTPTPPGVASPLSSPPLPPPPASPPAQAYGAYSYGAPGGGGAPVPQDFGMHQQHYVPGEGETEHKYKKGEGRGKLEENAGRLERGLTGALKRFEKRFG